MSIHVIHRPARDDRLRHGAVPTPVLELPDGLFSKVVVGPNGDCDLNPPQT